MRATVFACPCRCFFEMASILACEESEPQPASNGCIAGRCAWPRWRRICGEHGHTTTFAPPSPRGDAARRARSPASSVSSGSHRAADSLRHTFMSGRCRQRERERQTERERGESESQSESNRQRERERERLAFSGLVFWPNAGNSGNLKPKLQNGPSSSRN